MPSDRTYLSASEDKGAGLLAGPARDALVRCNDGTKLRLRRASSRSRRVNREPYHGCPRPRVALHQHELHLLWEEAASGHQLAGPVRRVACEIGRARELPGIRRLRGAAHGVIRALKAGDLRRVHDGDAPDAGLPETGRVLSRRMPIETMVRVLENSHACRIERQVG